MGKGSFQSELELGPEKLLVFTHHTNKGSCPRSSSSSLPLILIDGPQSPAVKYLTGRKKHVDRSKQTFLHFHFNLEANKSEGDEGKIPSRDSHSPGQGITSVKTHFLRMRVSTPKTLVFIWAVSKPN
ncbi:unnamed protein product [Allacma fusca]|uniref:Uncharacterized protein n=1 Tax=Allacma fusca TaxID=39272 RepID=A0A8J2KVW3_9HEXA|nr:unnamed protein product [Allacma fusca]